MYLSPYFQNSFNYDLTPNRETGENKTNSEKFQATSPVLHPKGIFYNAVAYSSGCLLHKNYELANGGEKSVEKL